MKPQSSGTIAAVAVMAAAAMGFTPGFEVTVSTQTPAPQELVSVEVTLDSAFSDFPAEHLSDILGVLPADSVGENSRPDGPYEFIPVELDRVGAGVYRGTFEAPSEPGEFLLVTFPNEVRELPVANDYPTPLPLSVRERGMPVATVLVALSLVLALGAGRAALGRRRERAHGRNSRVNRAA